VSALKIAWCPTRSVAGGADLNFSRPELALTTVLTTVLAIAPILVVFLFSQRALVSGMLAGATKE
jgi:multiple sugar transport system permease protein